MDIEIEYDRGVYPSYGSEPVDDNLTFNIEPFGKGNVEIRSGGHKKKKTESKQVKEILNRMLECNFQKVYEEMAGNLGLDGTSLTLRFGDLNNFVHVYMWCPSVRRFEESGWSESAKLLAYVQDLLKIAETLGYKIDPELRR